MTYLIHANALFLEVREVTRAGNKGFAWSCQEALGSLDTWKTNHIAMRQKKLTLKFLGWRGIPKKGWQMTVPLNSPRASQQQYVRYATSASDMKIHEVQHIQTFKDLIPTNHGLIHFPQPVLFFHSFGSKPTGQCQGAQSSLKSSKDALDP